MSEIYISLYAEKAEAFEDVKGDLGPDGVEPSNVEVVMRLIETYEAAESGAESGRKR
jgi:hypothetical protein